MSQNKILIFSSLFLLMGCSSGRTVDETVCEIHSQSKSHYELIPETFILHDVSKYYFLSQLKTLTYHQGYYYNLAKDKKNIYQFKFTARGNDTIDVLTTWKMSLSAMPKDICFRNKDLYVLFDDPFAKLYKYPDLLSRTNTDYEPVGELVIDKMNLLPNARTKINSGRYITGMFNPEQFDFSDPDQKYFAEFDISDKKIASEFCNIYEMDERNYYPSMEIPYRLDLDSISIVSPGFNNTIEVFNIQTGSKKGSYCAKSAFVNKVNGIDQKGEWDFQVQFNWLIGTSYYLDILFDENSKYFYRIAKHEQVVKDHISHKLNKTENAPWSLVVLDSNLNYIDEINFEAKTLNFLKHFSDSDGIHFLSIDSLHKASTDSILNFKKLNIL